MISAQSRLLQLNGNNFILFLVILSFLCNLFACGTSKSITPVEASKKSSEPVKVSPHKEVPVTHDTVAKKEVLVPHTGKIDTPVHVPVQSKASNQMSGAKPFGSKTLSHIKIAALLPFGANNSDSSTINGRSRFVQFYAGMKLALDQYEESSLSPVSVHVYDVSDLDETQNTLKELEKNLPSVIIGPYKADALKYAAEWAKKNKITLISPWISSSSITTGNPYYLQMKAGLNAHFKAINEHVRKHFNPSSVFLVSRSESESRAKYFNLPDSTPFKEVHFTEDELAQSQDILFEPFFQAEGPTVFILPMLSNKDENYVYQFLRRLSSEKKDRQVVVYGTYRWLDLKSDIIDYLSTLKVRLSMSNFSESDQVSVKGCRMKYYEHYGEFPSSDALEAYDLVHFVLNELNQKTAASSSYLQTQFEIEPVYKSNVQENMIDYFENRYVRIIQISNYKLKIIE